MQPQVKPSGLPTDSHDESLPTSTNLEGELLLLIVHWTRRQILWNIHRYALPVRSKPA